MTQSLDRETVPRTAGGHSGSNPICGHHLLCVQCTFYFWYDSFQTLTTELGFKCYENWLSIHQGSIFLVTPEHFIDLVGGDNLSVSMINQKQMNCLELSCVRNFFCNQFPIPLSNITVSLNVIPIFLTL